MKAQYLLRFDDICPTMNWEIWEEIEAVLCDQGIDPLLAVIPDNRDEMLRVSPPNGHFWDRVHKWEDRGWTIAMHGWQHQYVTSDGGIIGLNPYSEFAGLPRHEQEQKLRTGVEVFRANGIDSDVWIAPAHSFDIVTVKLLSELGFHYISDGFFFFPHLDEFGMIWIPQQLWSFRWRPFGVWTICFHINRWAGADVLAFRQNTASYRKAISSFSAIVRQFDGRQKTTLDTIEASVYRSLAQAKYSVKRGLTSSRPAAPKSERSFSPKEYV